MMNKTIVKLFALIFVAAVMNSCGGGKSGKVKSTRAGVNEVIVHINANPDKLNPVTHTNAYSQQITSDLFMSGLGLHPDSIGVMVPSLAVARPVITEITDGEYKGGLKIDFEIRPEAVWDNGSPVTGDDVAFTVKVWKNPKVDCEQGRPYYEFIKDVIVDPTNKKKYTVITKDRYFLSELQAAVTVMPEYVYDSKGIMRKFTIKELNDPTKLSSLKTNPDIIAFGDEFNSEFHARDPKGISGCGPYALEKWEANQRVVLKKKANWWGKPLEGKIYGFTALPEKIIYEIIPDLPASVSALKGEKLDVHYRLTSKDYLELSKDGKLSEKYNFYKPVDLGYSYVPMNTKNPKLADVRVRRALAHLMDVDQIIDKISLGMATRQVGPVSPLKPFFNQNIKPVEFSIEKANALLEEAGWKDTDGDGFRDKVLNGAKTKLEISVTIANGSPVAEKIVLLYKENCKKAGIDLNVQVKEFTVMADDLDHHNFEMSFLSWGGVNYEDDPVQLWHTKSYNGGSNFCGFGDQKTDALIDKIRYEQDQQKRYEYNKELQQMIVDAQPYIFLYSPLNRMAIHKRFDDAQPRLARPGFVVSEFRLNKEFGK